MSAPSPPPPGVDLNPTYGAMLIGLLFATFFQGVLSVQTYNYFENFREDPRRTKFIVALVWCLDTIHLVLIAQATYHYLITNWGNPPALMFSTWELDINLTFIGLSSIVCQVFFLHRIWIFSSHNILLIIVLACMCLTTLALDIVVSVQIISVPLVTEFGARKGEIIAVFTSGAASDVAIALLLCLYVRRGRSGFEKTNSLVSQVIQYIVATGLATSVLAIGCLVAYFAKPDGFIFVAMHFSLGRMYTNALLATLNSRRKLRATFDAASIRSKNTSARKPDNPVFTHSSLESSRPQYLSGSIAKFPIDSTYQGETSVPVRTQGLTPEYSFSLKDAHDHSIELDNISGKANLPLGHV